MSYKNPPSPSQPCFGSDSRTSADHCPFAYLTSAWVCSSSGPWPCYWIWLNTSSSSYLIASSICIRIDAVPLFSDRLAILSHLTTIVHLYQSITSQSIHVIGTLLWLILLLSSPILIRSWSSTKSPNYHTSNPRIIGWPIFLVLREEFLNNVPYWHRHLIISIILQASRSNGNTPLSSWPVYQSLGLFFSLFISALGQDRPFDFVFYFLFLFLFFAFPNELVGPKINTCHPILFLPMLPSFISTMQSAVIPVINISCFCAVHVVPYINFAKAQMEVP